MNQNIKSKLKLTALLLITAFPVTLATLSFNSAIQVGGLSTHNKGQLITPPVDITALDMRDDAGELVYRTFEEEVAGLAEDEFQPRPWLMVYVNASECEAQCQERLHYLRQLHVALGKNIQRVRRYYLHAADAPLTPANAEHFKTEFPSMGIAYSDATRLENNLQEAGVTLTLDSEDYVLLIDPVGNVMMYYTREQSPEDILADLKTLLRLSSLG